MPQRPHALIAAVVVFLLVLAAGEFWPSGGTPRVAAQGRVATVAAPAAALVDVVGAVLRPGVYRLAAGARVQDAIRAAGGASRRATLDQLDLAAAVADGQQIVVPREGHHGAGPLPPASGPAVPSVVHLNTADAAALDVLPGVGPATAARILAYRTQHGPFARVDDLLGVPGIGPAKLDAMRPQLAL